jgi:hypothetical protein
MAKSKTPKEPKVLKEKSTSKTLFDHLNAIYVTQDPNYFDTLNAADKKTWSNYMITRFISMNPDQIEIANYIQKYTTLPPEMLYRFYIDVIPRGKQYNRYIKSCIADKYGNESVNFIAKYFECSTSEAKEYMDILSDESLVVILKKYGINDKEIKKCLMP